MKKYSKREIINYLNEIADVCGDNLGRDGEYIDQKLKSAIQMVENMDEQSE